MQVSSCSVKLGLRNRGLKFSSLTSFLTWKIFIIFQAVVVVVVVVVVGRFHSFTRSLLHFPLDLWKPEGGAPM